PGTQCAFVIVHSFLLLDSNRHLSRLPRFEITIRQPLHPLVGVRIQPSLRNQVESQLAMLDRSMSFLANVAECNLFIAGKRHGKADSIPISLPGKIRTGNGIAEIAQFSDGGIARCDFWAGSAASAAPPCSQWQARGMKP